MSLEMNYKSNELIFHFIFLVQFVQLILDILKAATEEMKAETTANSFGMLKQLKGVFEKCFAGKGFFGEDTINRSNGVGKKKENLSFKKYKIDI